MVWSLPYSLTRNALGVMLLRVRGDTAKEVERVCCVQRSQDMAGPSGPLIRPPG
ncbi:hypothetical protein FDG2_0857 [Candidatus Protofrankia californiensis]|uniref:Uncharacterized protein n=1 Tax=Candidatus Protofrankia californiensis TaxID=1839754 RepID=A0A1C3NUE8_9ACTN|nr:hypothetical protein FDG2_0857 [Candidatus Protofrankia californiensis]